MKIGLVGNKLLIDQPAGVEKYIYQIFNALAKTDKENSYTIYLQNEPKKELWEKLIDNNKNFKYKVLKQNGGIFSSWVQLSLARELYNNPQDVVYYPLDTISGLLNIFKSKQFNAVCMIHDLGYKNINEYKNPITRFIHHNTIEFVVKNAKKII